METAAWERQTVPVQTYTLDPSWVAETDYSPDTARKYAVVNACQ